MLFLIIVFPKLTLPSAGMSVALKQIEFGTPTMRMLSSSLTSAAPIILSPEHLKPFPPLP